MLTERSVRILIPRTNNNNGTVALINPTTGHFDIIASGGTRGDYVGLDGNNGSLFLTQTNTVDRLSCGPGCFFTPPPQVPEPSTITIFGLAVGGVAIIRRRLGLKWPHSQSSPKDT